MGNAQAQTPNCNTTDTLPDDVPQQCTWMAGLRDELPLTVLSIPGTHCSCSAFLKYKSWRHQSLDVSHALKAGVRYFDVPMRLEKDSKLMLWQDEYPIERYFDCLLESLVYFLTLNTSEVVICRLAEAYSSECDKSFSDVICQEIERLVPERCFWPYPAFPETLGAARGKIIFLRDFPDGKVRLVPYNASVLSNHNGLPSDYEAFWNLIRKNLVLARDGNDLEMHITYTSHKNLYLSAAAVINEKLYQFLTENHPRRRWGIIAMDFPGSQLIKLIIQANIFCSVTQISRRNCIVTSKCENEEDLEFPVK